MGALMPPIWAVTRLEKQTSKGSRDCLTVDAAGDRFSRNNDKGSNEERLLSDFVAFRIRQPHSQGKASFTLSSYLKV